MGVKCGNKINVGSNGKRTIEIGEEMPKFPKIDFPSLSNIDSNGVLTFLMRLIEEVSFLETVEDFMRFRES